MPWMLSSISFNLEETGDKELQIIVDIEYAKCGLIYKITDKIN